MKELDLHRTYHEMVKPKVIRFIESGWGTNEEVKIITGHSKEMKSIVEEVLKEYKLDYKVGDFFGFDKTYITTRLE
jgi:hypothetical protein